MNRTFRFAAPGGLRLPGHKYASLERPIRPVPIPAQLVLPLSQHIGAPALPVVAPGAYVYRGQLLARAADGISAPVHASSSGTVVAVEPRPVPGTARLSAPCIVIATDAADRPLPDGAPAADPRRLPPEALRQRIHDAGIVGLGGAGFPSAAKLRPAQPPHTLILNGAECEPYITCDQSLMRERALDVLQGGQLLLQATTATRALVAIEDDKTDAITAMRAALADLGDARISLHTVPVRYPSGNSHQLVQALTGQMVPGDSLAIDVGAVVYNVGTAAAVWYALAKNEPLIRRIVTVTGPGIAEPQNFEVRLGTPLQSLVALAGGYTVQQPRLTMGGPMMGVVLHGDAVPVTKVMNCILVEAAPTEAPVALPCIGCADCVTACPVGLVPQALYRFVRAGALAQAESHRLFDCIECGCCTTVCPSRIPLVDHYREAKAAIRNAQRQQQDAAAARARFEARQRRLAREEHAREEARRRRKQALAARVARATERDGTS